MWPELLPHLRCPACRGAIALSGESRDSAGAVEAGILTCAGCARRFPIRAGVADFLGGPPPLTAAQRSNEFPGVGWAYERIWRPRALALLSGGPLPYAEELALVTGLAAPERGGLFLDVACSNGLYARALARAGGSGAVVAGVDQALPMLTEARRRAAAAGARVSYVRARAQALPFAGGGAAGVTIGGSLNEIGDLDGCLAEVRRALAPGGRFVAMSLTAHWRPAERAAQRLLEASGLRFWPSGQLVADFAAHGLRVTVRQQRGIVLFTLATPAQAATG